MSETAQYNMYVNSANVENAEENAKARNEQQRFHQSIAEIRKGIITKSPTKASQGRIVFYPERLMM